MNARLSFNTACELGFRGSLDEWERLMGAVARQRTLTKSDRAVMPRERAAARWQG